MPVPLSPISCELPQGILEGEALQLIRDRLRDETGFFKRARLWWDLVADVLAQLPSAYRNSYAATEAASLALNPAGIPAFKILDNEPLGLGSILVGGTISLVVLAAFALLLSWQTVVYRPLSGSNGRMSPIESVMQRLDRAPAPDSAERSPQHAAGPASAQMSEPQAQPPGASPLEAFSKGDTQAGLAANGQEFVNSATANARNNSPDSQLVAEHRQTPIPHGATTAGACCRRIDSVISDAGHLWHLARYAPCRQRPSDRHQE